MSADRLLNYIGGEWRSSTAETRAVLDPARGDSLAGVPLSTAGEVDAAAQTAAEALPAWQRTPAVERIQFLFRLKDLLEQHFEMLSRTITQENGKTLDESRGEMRRAIQNVEVACGIPSLMQGYNNEDIARGIDEHMIRQPVGVAACITPFNFPGMIPFWFMPYAIACGNTYIVKPSDRTPITMQKVFHLLHEIGLPRGVLNLVNGAGQTAEAMLDHPTIRAVSFVGSTTVARRVYARAAANGKRVQCGGGAKNPIVVLPDADPELTSSSVAESAYGCAGQRCLAASLTITVGQAHEPFLEAMSDRAMSRRVGYGLEDGVEMGPVITPESRARIEQAIERAERDGARVRVDGRGHRVDGYERGNFVRPTILEDLPPQSEIAGTEVFGPVLGVMHAESVEEAIELVNGASYGNMACLFTSSGGAARTFRNEVQAGNVGINVGVAAPMAFFPFSGWKESFFGDLHGQGRDAVEFFTRKKVIVERWLT